MKRLLVALLWAIPLAAQPQIYPNKPIRWIVPGYLAEGLSILAGRQKLGKTWLALDWAIAVA